jgi:hypothetical protein
MPRQNRVTPFGEIIATPERGTFLGNRGVLHDAAGRARRAWQLKRWIVCVLEFRGRHRQVMTPGRYTELFFLDEATALAAGHRPCAECRRERFLAFCDAWAVARSSAARPTAVEMDGRLHVERLRPDGTQRGFAADLDTLPNGVFVRSEGAQGQADLVWEDRLFAWSPAGYEEPRPRPKGKRTLVLTPKATVEAIRAGYEPAIHSSVKIGCGEEYEKK